MTEEASGESTRAGRGFGPSEPTTGGSFSQLSGATFRSGRPSSEGGTPQTVQSQFLAFAEELLDGCAVGIAILDADLRVACVNAALTRTFALSREATHGLDYRCLVHRHLKRALEDPEQFATGALEGGPGPEAEALECHVLPGDGRQERWLEYRSQKIRTGLYAGGRIEHFYDITHRKLAQESLETSRRLFERMFISMRDPVFVVDGDMTIVQCNPAASEVFGYTEDEMVGQNTAMLYASPESRDQFSALMMSGLREKGYLHLSEVPLRRKNGDLFPTDLTVVPLERDVGERTGYVAVVRDVSQRVALDEMKSSFVASVSHELRSPLSSIMGYAEILLDSAPDELTPIQREFLDVIYESSQRLRWLVDDILDVSRSDAGQFALELTEVEPGELVRRSVERLLPEAQEAGLEVSVHLGDDLPQIRADPRRLGQVLENLIGNAIHFTPTGGQVSVAARPEGEDQLVLQVSDTGIGIEPDEIDAIFERFHRGRNVGDTGPSGTGLGLYIVRAIVEGHGGRVEVESEPGKGSTFRVYLPLSGPSDMEF